MKRTKRTAWDFRSIPMSAPKRRLVITAEAKANLSNILRYTTQQWGRQQRSVYRAKIMDSLQALARHPDIGRVRSELAGRPHSFPIGQHVVYYFVDDQTVTVVRILHGKMDAAAQLAH